MIERDFFLQDTRIVARELLGKEIVLQRDGQLCIAKIVETEAYLGIKDRGAHTFGGRRTKRNEVMYGPGGKIYVYFTYGMHYLMNFVTREAQVPEAVLIRGVEPLCGVEHMAYRRYGKAWEELSTNQQKNMTNGPAKLTKALGIDLAENGKDVFREKFFLREGDKPHDIVTDRRVGIDYAEEAVHYPYRFFISDNPHVSVKVQKPFVEKEK